MPPKRYQTEEAKKAAAAKRKAEKRAAVKEAMGIPIRPKLSKTENAEQRKRKNKQRMRDLRANLENINAESSKKHR